jgi:hypothetical protein
MLNNGWPTVYRLPFRKTLSLLPALFGASLCNWIVYLPCLTCDLPCIDASSSAGGICIFSLYHLQGPILLEGSCPHWQEMANVEVSFLCYQRYTIHICSSSICKSLKKSFSHFPLSNLIKWQIVLYYSLIQVISALAYLVYFIDRYQQYWLRTAWGFENKLVFTISVVSYFIIPF